jgi:hypothetical protein
MESNGVQNRIQISQSTADELQKAGKEHWFHPRDELVNAKGKGEMQTYWLSLKQDNRTSIVSDNSNDKAAGGTESTIGVDSEKDVDEIDHEKADANRQRMVGWAVDILSHLLKQIVAARNSSPTKPKYDDDALGRLERSLGRGDGTVLDEATDFLPIPKFDPDLAERVDPSHTVTLDAVVVDQLREYVGDIASMYRDNPFHNMEHAIHVTMSISKLMGRIVAADVAPGETDYGQSHILRRLHDRTYGIAS